MDYFIFAFRLWEEDILLRTGDWHNEINDAYEEEWAADGIFVHESYNGNIFPAQ